MFEINKIISVFKALSLIFVIFVFSLILFDKIIMPLYIHRNEEVILPDVLNKNYDEAKLILESKDFRMIVEDRKPIDTHPPNVVLIQNPIPNSVVRKGRRVYVTLSTILNPVIVPSLIGSSEREAEIKLSNLGLVVGFVERDFFSFYPLGVVANQSPLSGTRVRKGELVDITVSLGNRPDEVIVPDIVMKNLEIAKEDIKKAGLKIKNLYNVIDNELLPNTVLGIAFGNEEISPGTPLKPGDSIDIYISNIDTTMFNQDSINLN